MCEVDTAIKRSTASVSCQSAATGMTTSIFDQQRCTVVMCSFTPSLPQELVQPSSLLCKHYQSKKTHTHTHTSRNVRKWSKHRLVLLLSIDRGHLGKHTSRRPICSAQIYSCCFLLFLSSSCLALRTATTGSGPLAARPMAQYAAWDEKLPEASD